MVTVISFDRHSFGRLLPFLLYPSVLMAWAGIPLSLLLKRTALALPFCLFAGLSNLILEREAAFTLGALTVTQGFVSLCTLLLRTCLCVMAVLILAATTPLPRLSAQLRRFHVPALFIMVMEIMYRYIGTLLGEAHSMSLAYTLRGGGKGVALSHVGSFTGRLFLRCVDRAERVYAAMKCRLYSLDLPPRDPQPLRLQDGIFLATVTAACAFFRWADIPLILGRGIGGLLS
jgi:cobalt/nickel transport system permease protein